MGQGKQELQGGVRRAKGAGVARVAKSAGEPSLTRGAYAESS